MKSAIDPRLLAIDKKVFMIMLLHIPFVGIFAPIGYDTQPFAIIATAIISAIGIAAYFTLKGTRLFGIVAGIVLLLFSVTLIQAQMGRIEMHFHIFVALAFLLIYKDWLVIAAVAGVGAVQHVLFTYLQLNDAHFGDMPIILFNYDCSWSILFLHALFVVFEAAVLIYYAIIMRKDEVVANNVVDTFNQVSQTSEFSARINQDKNHPSVIASNNLLESIEDSLTQINSVMHDIANGKFDSRITQEYKGDLAEVKDSVNASAESVTNTMTALNNLMNSLSDGDFSARLDNRVSGDLRQNVNNTMHTIEVAVTEVGSVIQRLSEGDLSARVDADLKGDLDNLKQNTNTSMERLASAISEISNVISAQSNGDLTTSVKQEMRGELDHLKHAINQSNQSLHNVMQQVIETARIVSDASTEVSDGSSNLNDRTQQQAAALEQTAASMEELMATIKQNTDNAVTADQLAKEASEQAHSSRAIMDQTEEAIHQIHDSSKQIEEITALIDSIAFQTNLLALNAAVEAARAGEHGRGFAVVAGEVRTLAGKSADAAKDIKTLIENSVKSIQLGTEKMTETSDSLTKIQESIQSVSNIVAEISNASQEQQQGVSQVNAAVANIDSTTQQNAALVEETTHSAQSMSQQSGKLTNVVSTFKV